MCKQAMHEIRQKIHLCKKEHESARNPLNERCRNRKNGEEAFASSPHLFGVLLNSIYLTLTVLALDHLP